MGKSYPIHQSYDKSILREYGINDNSPYRCEVLENPVYDEYSVKVREVVQEYLKDVDGKYNIISLGEACFVRKVLSHWGIKKLKEEGELSCPFDLSVHSVKSIIHILNDRFKHFLDLKYLTVNEKSISNSYYNSGYIHEHKEHEYEDRYEKFKRRYSKRIRNFFNYCFSDKFPFFIQKVVSIEHCQVVELEESIKNLTYKNNKIKRHKLIILRDDDGPDFESGNIIVKNIIKPSEDYKWYLNTHSKTILGVEHDVKVIDYLKKVVLNTLKN